MAPRQRVTSPASLHEVAAPSASAPSSRIACDKEPFLLSRRSSVSSSGSSGSASDDEVYVTISPAASYTVSAKVQAKSPKAGEAERQQAAAAAAAADAADSAREQHDVFNLVALLVVVGTTLCNWNFGKFLQGYGPAEAWTGQHFYLNWAVRLSCIDGLVDEFSGNLGWALQGGPFLNPAAEAKTTVVYFLIDLIWVSLIPICVKSPDVIVKHHIVAIAYLSAPLALPEYRWFMGACLSVEINTWFLILRRVIYKRRHPQMFQDAVSISFYLSWIVIRCFIYPAILVVFLGLAAERVADTQRLWHWPMVFIPVHFFLCLLNLKWSYDLFEPVVRKWISKDGDGPIIASGL